MYKFSDKCKFNDKYKTRKSEDKLSLHHGCPESSGASERVARSLDGSCTCFEISQQISKYNYKYINKIYIKTNINTNENTNTNTKSSVGQVREWRGDWMDCALASKYCKKYEDITTNTSTNTNIKKIQIQIQMKMQIQIQKVQW